jgi:AraC family ethanolamine operon transcriptional activator
LVVEKQLHDRKPRRLLFLLHLSKYRNHTMKTRLTGCAGSIEVDDIDAYPETMGQWDLEIRQISPGKFHGTVEFLEVAGLLVYREQWTHRAITDATSPVDSFMLISNSPRASTLDWCGKNVQSDLIGYCHPGSDIRGITPDGHEHLILEIPRQVIEKIVPAEDTDLLRKSDYHFQVDPLHGMEFFETLDRTISHYQAHNDALNDELECRVIEMQIMGKLTELILRDSTDMGVISKQTYDTVLDRALEFIHNQNTPVTLTEIAHATGFMPRTLQRAFKEKLNISPLKYLRISRLHAAHRELRIAEGCDTTVTEIALKWGFNELGRFASEYKQLFGECPSTTLSQQKYIPARDMYSAIRI